METPPVFTRRLSRRDLFVVGLIAAGIPTALVGGVSLYLFTRHHLQSHLLFPYRTHTSGTFALAWSPDSTRIASGDFDGPIQVWQIVP